MAGVGTPMQITPVDEYRNLFAVRDLFPQSLVEKILFTPWMQLKWERMGGQETWARRRIFDTELPWAEEWNVHIVKIWPELEKALGYKLQSPRGGSWWVDEPGFVVGVHTDGSLPGAMQITWISDNPSLGTCFYHDKNKTQIRKHFLAEPNAGYIMLNPVNQAGYTHLHWHGMENPVPAGTFRVSSYTLIYPE